MDIKKYKQSIRDCYDKTDEKEPKEILQIQKSPRLKTMCSN